VSTSTDPSSSAVEVAPLCARAKASFLLSGSATMIGRAERRRDGLSLHSHLAFLLLSGQIPDRTIKYRALHAHSSGNTCCFVGPEGGQKGEDYFPAAL